MKKFAREFFRLQIFFLHVTRCVISSRFFVSLNFYIRAWMLLGGVYSSASVLATGLATIRIFLILLQGQWSVGGASYDATITNNRTFTRVELVVERNVLTRATLHRCWHWFPIQLYALYFPTNIFRLDNGRSLRKLCPSISREEDEFNGKRDGKYAAPLESSFLTVRSIIVRNRTVCNLWNYQLWLLCKRMV